MQIWCKNADFRALRSTRMERSDSTALTLHSGRNMTAAWQVLLRADMQEFTLFGVTFESLPEGIEAKAHIQGYIVYNDGTPYPDVLTNDESVEVKRNATQSIVIVLKVPAGFAVGDYRIGYTVRTNAGDFALEAKLKVHSAEIAEPKDAFFGHEYFVSMGAMCGSGEGKYQYQYSPYYNIGYMSDKWWEHMAAVAHIQKTMRINSLYLHSVDLLIAGGSVKTETGWDFKFDVLDRYVSMMLAEGSYKYITVSAIIRSVYGESITGIGEDGKGCALTIFEPEADAWLDAYLPAMRDHFTEKGWIDMLRMHIEDEPHSSEYWNWMRAKIKEHIPSIKCSEPIDTEGIGDQIKEGCDCFIPRINVFEPEMYFYNNRADAGLNELWVYSCCYPEEQWWLNKFIDLPQHYSRFMKYACFSNKITGFLHWGFNFWTGDPGLYGLHPDARFKGDGFIIYPDVANNDFLLSNRALATIEGIEDYELLEMLRGKNAEQAYAISRSVAKTFRDFADDSGAAELAREKILTMLDD